MMRSLYTSATGMAAQQFNVDVISNNLANVQTNGFKRARVDFEDLLYQTLRTPGTPTSEATQVPVGVQVGHGVRKVATPREFSLGTLESTENDLDMAIEGDGFFQIRTRTGEIAYTRDGAFKLDSDRRLVTSNGDYLEPEIIIPEDATRIHIGSSGIISVKRPNEVDLQEIGQVELVRFVNSKGLVAIGKNMFKESASSGSPIIGEPETENFGSIAQHFLEKSNVQVVEEMVNLITAQRAYETNSKAIQTADSMLGIANALKRG